MDQRITDSLKSLFSAQHVTVTGDSIAEVLADGFTKLNNATISSNRISGIIQNCVDTGTFSGGGLTELTWDGPTFTLTEAPPTDWNEHYYQYFSKDEDTGKYSSVPLVEEGQPIPGWAEGTYYRLNEEFVSVYSSRMSGYGFLIKASDKLIDSSHEIATLMLNQGKQSTPVPASMIVDSNSTQLIYYVFSAVVSVNSDNQTISINNMGTQEEVVFPEKGTYLLYIAAPDMRMCIDGFNLIIAETASWNEDNTVTIPEYSHMAMTMLSNTGYEEGQYIARLSEDALFSADYDGYYVFDADDSHQYISTPAWSDYFEDVTADDQNSKFKYDGKPYLASKNYWNGGGFSIDSLVTTEDNTNVGTINKDGYDNIKKCGTYIRYYHEHDFTYIERIPSSVAFEPIVCTESMFDESKKLELANGYYAYKISDNFIPTNTESDTLPGVYVERETTQYNSNWHGLTKTDSQRDGKFTACIMLNNNDVTNPGTYFITSSYDNASATITDIYGHSVTFAIPEKGTYIGALSDLSQVTDIRKVVLTNYLQNHTSISISEEPTTSFGSEANEYVLLDNEGYQLSITGQTYSVTLDGTTYADLPSSGITTTLVDMDTETMDIPVAENITLHLLTVRDYRFTKDNIVFKPRMLGTYMLKSEAEAYNYRIAVTSA